MSDTLIIVVIQVTLFAVLGGLIWSRTGKKDDAGINVDLKLLQQEVGKFAPLLRDELRINREELASGNATNRAEMARGSKAIEDQLERIRKTVEERLEKLQTENTKKLEEMRQTVDEKLQSTLDRRLSESFKQVSERLEQVHNGLGDMKNLATGVGDLKKVLTNVKNRGILGEIQLERLLEDILAPDQFERNVNTNKDSKDHVEFAIKMPGRDGVDHVYLPIDSKFPSDLYERLLKYYDEGDLTNIESATKELISEIKKQAKVIKDKYLNPPFTTDFGILFLPFEGLYAEVARHPDLLQSLQRDPKIVIAGPTTLAAILNSLQMGFRTLAIEKRSSEVWGVLAQVKKEFDNFGNVLQKAREKIASAGEEIDKLVTTRTKKIQSQFKKLESLPAPEGVVGVVATGLEDED